MEMFEVFGIREVRAILEPTNSLLLSYNSNGYNDPYEEIGGT